MRAIRSSKPKPMCLSIIPLQRKGRVSAPSAKSAVYYWSIRHRDEPDLDKLCRKRQPFGKLRSMQDSRKYLLLGAEKRLAFQLNLSLPLQARNRMQSDSRPLDLCVRQHSCLIQDVLDERRPECRMTRIRNEGLFHPATAHSGSSGVWTSLNRA